MRFLSSAAVLLGSFLIGMTSANAQGTLCGDRTEMVKALHDEFREEPQAIGQVDESAIIEIFASPTGTWTILATGTDGMSCLVASGTGWDSQKLMVGIDS